MNAARLLETAHAAGLSFQIEGGNLIVEADRDFPTELIAELREHKAALMAVLSGRDAQSVSEAIKMTAPSQASTTGWLSRRSVLLHDGRRLYRFRADHIPDATPDWTTALMSDARWRGVVLVADGHDLIVVEPWLSTLATETLREIREKSGGVIAALLGRKPCADHALCARARGRRNARRD